jgi:large subunit ribosomal protein L15
MELNDLKHADGARKKRKRVGRGIASGKGRTCGRGHKGQKSRSGGKIPNWFEGGQMPLARRTPRRGFTNPTRTEYEILNLRDLERSGLTGDVTEDVLRASGVASSSKKPVKILAMGEITAVLNLKVHAISKKAQEKIEAKGGTVELLD